ncbi:hypothetical protein CKN80_08980 [Carnobacterium divergens]|nr:hypothetical protein CKN79_08265 [Carnobacterium divergens]TFJ51077.1 hypothetical protein CKN80_08980 [Carnobacterium divergens]
MKMMLFNWFMAGLLVLIGVINGMTPFYGRKTSQFGISLPNGFQNSEKIRALKFRFFILNMVTAVLLALPFLFIGNSFSYEILAKWSAIYLMVSMVIYFLVSGLIFLKIRNQLKEYKKNLPRPAMIEEEIVVDTSYRNNRLVIPGSVIIITNFLLILITVCITFANFDKIPPIIPTHWTVGNVADGFAEKSVKSLLALPALQVVLMVVMYLSNYSFQKAKQQINASKISVSIHQNQAFRFAWSVYLLLVSILIQCLLMLIQFISIFDLMDKLNVEFIIIGFVGLVIAGSLFLTVKYGQGGERYRKLDPSQSENQVVATYDDDTHWKLGVFYFNPKDPAIWVEKRFGIGTSMNFARGQSWGMMIGIIVLPLVVIFLFS